MSGPGFLSLTITDSVFCDGNAHPDSGMMSIVYDLAGGKPVDWTHLLPASLTGTVALEEQGDGTKIVTLASKRLFELYVAGYAAGEPPSSDQEECRQAILDQATDGPPGMMVWLDASGAVSPCRSACRMSRKPARTRSSYPLRCSGPKARNPPC